jgi:hypothetical protein
MRAESAQAYCRSCVTVRRAKYSRRFFCHLRLLLSHAIPIIRIIAPKLMGAHGTPPPSVVDGLGEAVGLSVAGGLGGVAV